MHTNSEMPLNKMLTRKSLMLSNLTSERVFVEFSISALWAFFSTMLSSWKRDRPLRHLDTRAVILRQIFFTGSEAFRLISLAAIIIGTVTVIQSGAQLRKFGGADALGSILVAAFIREVGPLVTTIVVVARSVSAMASELASMRANGEIDSLRACGVSPQSYLVVPRVLSGAIATLLLAMHFVWISFTVGFFTSQVFVNIPFDRFVDNVLTGITGMDLVIFFVKTALLGSVVFLMACYCGLRTSGASYEIPQATTMAVVWSFMFVFVMQLSISGLYYFFVLQRSGLLGML